MSTIRHFGFSLGIMLLTAGCSDFTGDTSPTPNGTPDPPTPRQDGIRIVGSRLVKAGQTWVAKGLYQIAFEIPPAELPYQKKFWATAQNNYSPTEYTDMIGAGADTVRMQVAQPGVDPQNSLYDKAFVDKFIAAVKSARAAGLTVIISVQDEPQTGDPVKSTALPTDATQRVWQTIAPVFGADLGVVYEMFNEPHVGPQGIYPFPAPDWAPWAVAMNTTIQTIRSAGATNVVVADGLEYAHVLTGAPQLTDPLSQTAYAAHVFPTRTSQNSEAWNVEFGNFAAQNPVIITEWVIGYYCDNNTPSSVVSFLQYLHSEKIGLVATAWDWATPVFGSVRYDFPNGKFSSFLGPNGPISCEPYNYAVGFQPGFGVGALVETLYKTGIPATSIE